MPNVIPFPQPVAAPEPPAGRPHDWLLPHMALLLRYCASNGLSEEETALAEVIERLVTLRHVRVPDVGVR